MTIPIPSREIPDPTESIYRGKKERREWWRWHMAGQAMQGLLAADHDDGMSKAVAARLAVGLADALIAELEKEGK